MTYDTSWQKPAPFARQQSKRDGMSMYGGDASNAEEAPSSGMYAPQTAPWSGGLPAGLNFTNLNAGGTNEVASGDTSIRSAGPDQTGMYQAYTNLLGTGLQTDAQRDVAETNIQPAMAKLDFTKTTAFPFLQDLIKQYGLGGGAGGGLNSLMTGSVLNANNPMREQEAIHAAEAATERAADEARQQGLRNVVGSGWSPNSPIGAALTASALATQARDAESAKRAIRNDFGQQRITNLAQAINAQNATINPIYSLLSSLMS